MAAAILALNLFVLSPWLTRLGKQDLAQTLYLTLRIVVFVGLAFVLVRFSERSRFQAMSLTTLAAFVDQVVFKSIWFAATWGELAPGNLAMTLAMGYVSFVPAILILAFLGSELNQAFRGRSRSV